MFIEKVFQIGLVTDLMSQGHVHTYNIDRDWKKILIALHVSRSNCITQSQWSKISVKKFWAIIFRNETIWWDFDSLCKIIANHMPNPTKTEFIHSFVKHFDLSNKEGTSRTTYPIHSRSIFFMQFVSSHSLWSHFL